MKKFLAIIILIPLIFCSCQESEQIDELSFVKLLAIDKTEEGFILTAGIEVPTSKKDEKPGSEILSVKCQTLSQGLNLLEAATEKKIFYGQVSCVLIGEAMARSGIIDTMDYLVRSDELRFDIPVVVVKEKSARDVVESNKENETHISERIVKMLESNYSTSSSGVIELSTLVEMLEDPYHSPYLPYIKAGEKDNFTVEGYCIFDKDELIAYADEQQSLGINFLNSTVKNCLFIADIDSKFISLKVSGFKSKIKLKNGVYDIKIDFKSEIVQADSDIQVFDTSLNQKIIEYQNTWAKDIIEETMSFLKQHGADVAAFGDTFHNNSPKEAEKYQDNWSEVFPKITYNINVTSKTNPSKNSGKPVKQGGD